MGQGGVDRRNNLGEEHALARLCNKMKICGGLFLGNGRVLEEMWSRPQAEPGKELYVGEGEFVRRGRGFAQGDWRREDSNEVMGVKFTSKPILIRISKEYFEKYITK